jgi:hypothetical protein
VSGLGFSEGFGFPPDQPADSGFRCILHRESETHTLSLSLSLSLSHTHTLSLSLMYMYQYIITYYYHTHAGMISYYTFQSDTSGGGARGGGGGGEAGDLDVVESLPPIREGGALGEGVVGAVCVHFTYMEVHVPLYTQTISLPYTYSVHTDHTHTLYTQTIHIL